MYNLHLLRCSMCQNGVKKQATSTIFIFSSVQCVKQATCTIFTFSGVQCVKTVLTDLLDWVCFYESGDVKAWFP